MRSVCVLAALVLLLSLCPAVERSLAPDLDVPFEPTHPEVVAVMLKLAEVGEGDRVVDLGCGDGRIVTAAARLYGARGRGVDMDPRRVREARENAEFDDLGDRVQIEQGDIFQTDLHDATVVTLYLLDPINLRLRPKLFCELAPGARVVSHAFHMDEWEADKVVEHPKARNQRIFLWRIPAQAGGTWKTELGGIDGREAARLLLRQEFQFLAGALTFSTGSTTRIEEGRLMGKEIAFRATLPGHGATAVMECRGTVEGDHIRGSQRVRIGEKWKEYEWHAVRDHVDLAGRWRIDVAGSRSSGGTLVIERREGDLRAGFMGAGSADELEPLESFYSWGASVLFQARVAGQILRFCGLLEMDQGGGVVNNDGWAVARNWIGARDPVVTPERPEQDPAGGAGGPAPGDAYINPIDGSVLVWIPSGDFLMGSDEGNEDERPRHRQSVEGFWLGKYEITNAQYSEFLKANPERREPLFWRDPAYSRPDYPVVGLTWRDGVKYCTWAGLRMPTEAEWEYAASGGKQHPYPTADGGLDRGSAAFRDKNVGSQQALYPVGSFPPNPFGIHEMAGNAWEFTSSVYRPYPYSAVDGREMHADAGELIVLRGGAGSFPARYCRTAARQYFAPHLQYDFAGLRVARSAVAKTVEKR
jgi:formylglycine-generating enzyme required for sulfatase activity/SAM-dependent methyltransferase